MKKDRIIVFGTGRYAEQCWKFIESDYEIIAILDNGVNKGTHGKFNGIDVYNPSDYSIPTDIPVLVLVWHYRDIVDQLLKQGVSSNLIMIGEVDDYGLRIITAEKIQTVCLLPEEMLHADWGFRRGTPIDRVYIDEFIKSNKQYILGNIMEVGDLTYSKKYSAKEKVIGYTSIHVDDVPGCRKADLESGYGLNDNEFDTMIITQTLAYIYNLQRVAQNIYRSLKKNGYLLLTVTDIGHMGKTEIEKYGTYWGFHKQGIVRLFGDVFGEENVSVKEYGNIQTVVAQLYGLSAEDLTNEQIQRKDSMFPLIIGLIAHKE